MAIALVQQGKNSATIVSSVAVTLGAAITNGNAVVIFVRHDDTIAGIIGAGGTPVLKKSVVSGGQELDIYVLLNASAGTSTVTVNTGVGATIHAIVAEFSGVATSAADDGTGSSATSTSTTPAPGNFVPTNADDVLLEAIGYASTASYSSGPTGAFTRLTPPAGAGAFLIDAGYRLTKSADASNPVTTLSGSVLWEAAQWALKAATSVSPSNAQKAPNDSEITGLELSTQAVWFAPDNDAGDAPRITTATAATVAQMAALWPDPSGQQDRSLQPVWFDAGIGHGDWVQPSNLTVATAAQDAALWPDGSGQQDITTQPVWSDPDAPRGEFPQNLPTPTFATAAQDAALWPEQPGQEASLQPAWADPGIGHGDWVAIPNLTVATVDQMAALWPDPSGQQDASLQPVWADPDDALGEFPQNRPTVTVATVDQMAALWPEQIGQEASLQPVWMQHDEIDASWRYIATQPENAPLWPEQIGQEASLQPVWWQDGTEVWVAIPGLTVATVDQMAALWPEQPGSEASLQPVWLDLDGVHDFGIPFATYPLAPGPLAALWPEQPGSEASLQPVWFRPDEPMEGIPFIIYPLAPGPAAALWPEQPGSERSLQPAWWYPDPLQDTVLPEARRYRRTRRIQYHLIVFSPDANGGPGLPKAELDSDALNATWMQTLNGPGAMAFALYRRNKKLATVDWMQDHVKLYRETDAGTKVVFAGKLVKPVYSAIDVLAYCWDYTAFLQLSRTGYKVAYPNTNIGTGVISAEWALAKALTNSPFSFVTTGTIQDPLAIDAVTPIKTNADFGMVDFNRLFAFGTLAEMSMANTANNVKFEITRESPHTFNLWKNYGANAIDFAGASPGNLASYEFDPGYDSVRHDLATVLSDGHGGHAEFSVQSADANTTLYRRLQQALVIRTLFGTSTNTPETDQGIAALRRQLAVAARYPRSITSQPREGEFDPFVVADVGDLQRYSLQNVTADGDQYDGYVRLIEIVGTYTKAHGELLQLRHRGVA